MAQKVLNYESLGEFDCGIIGTAMNLKLRQAVQDCRDREGETKPRKITATLLIAPLPDQTGQADDVELQWTCNLTCPPIRTRPYRLGIRKNDTLVFQEDALDNPDQNTLPYGVPEDADDE